MNISGIPSWFFFRNKFGIIFLGYMCVLKNGFTKMSFTILSKYLKWILWLRWCVFFHFKWNFEIFLYWKEKKEKTKYKVIYDNEDLFTAKFDGLTEKDLHSFLHLSSLIFSFLRRYASLIFTFKFRNNI